MISRSKTTRQINIGGKTGKRDLFKIEPGFSPDAFNTRLLLNQNGGIFLGLTEDFDRSIPRYFEEITRKTIRNVSSIYRMGGYVYRENFYGETRNCKFIYQSRT